MNKKKPLAATLATLLVAAPAAAADPTLADVVVSGAQEAPLSQPDVQPWAHSQVSREGVKILGGPGQTNPNRLLDLMPSVNAEQTDAYGLGFTRNINLRGKSEFHFSRDIEGVPLAGIVGGGDLFDLENVAAFELFRSAMPAYAGLGISSTTGAYNLTLRRPEQQFGVELNQGFGSDNFRRTFVRIDSGRLGPADTRFFVSASDTEADKWKGAGQAPAERRNLTLGLVQPFAGGAYLEVFAVSTDTAAHDYRAMTYAQTRDKSNWRHFDYDTTLTTGRRQLYYDFNRQTYDDNAVLANLVLPIGETGRLSLRPYYWDDNGYRLFAAGTRVRNWDITHEQKGWLAQYDGKLSQQLDLVVGYWWMNMESPPPPVSQKDYTVNGDGSLTFANWALLSKQGKHEFRSPYAQLTGKFGATTVSGGARYYEQHVPYFSYYTTTGLTDVSYGDVWAANPAKDPWQQVPAKTFREWLPNLSLRHELTPTLALTADYGRRMGRPDWGPVATTYASNRARFVANGVSLEQVFQGLKPETSDNYDLGLRYDSGRLSLAPNLYFARSHDKEVNVYDPLVGVSYAQSVAPATAKGVELEGSYRVDDSLTAIFAVSYNRFSFDGDVQTRSGTVTPTDGKQVPNSAHVVAKLGVDWNSGPWTVAPILRYVGRRYGDILNHEKVDPYFLADLHARYEWHNVAMLRELSLGVSALNLFDRKYIGLIASNDLDLNAGTSYYAGAPRTLAMTLSAKY